MDERQPRLLVVKLSSLGDVVHSLPTLAALRRHFPGAFIGWCVGQAAAPLVAGHPLLDVAFVLREGEIQSGPGVVVRRSSPSLAWAVRPYRFGIALDLQGLFKSAWLAYLSGAPRRLGYRNWQEGAFVFNQRTVTPRRVHAVENYLDFARALGAEVGEPEFIFPELAQNVARAGELLAQTGAVGRAAVLLPSAGWQSKRWLPERFGALARELTRRGLQPLVVTTAKEANLGEVVVKHAAGTAINVAGRTRVGDLAPLFRQCRLVVGHDSGPVHIAAAVGAPVVAIYGPTLPELTGPYGPRVEVVQAQVPCQPCRRRECGRLLCQEAVSTEMVLKAADRLLAG